MSLYAVVELSVETLTLVVASVGGVYAVRALLVIYGEAEMFKIQRRIWLPLLAAGGLLAFDAFLDWTGDLMKVLDANYLPSDLLTMTSGLLLLVSLTLVSVAIFRYYGLQKGYRAMTSTGGR